MLNELELTGRARTHVVQRDDLKAAVHPQALDPFLAMKADAAREGIDMAITSAFRDFTAQQRIWNMKWRGERPLLDAHGCERDRTGLTPRDIVQAILCWSALPGASRHHWGTELDLIDRAGLPEGYRVRLVPSEAEPGGPFHALHCWLDANMHRYAFFRPYSTFRGGVLPERWHLSYYPLAALYTRMLTPELLRETIEAADMMLKDVVLEHLPAIFERFVANTNPAFA